MCVFFVCAYAYTHTHPIYVWECVHETLLGGSLNSQKPLPLLLWINTFSILDTCPIWNIKYFIDTCSKSASACCMIQVKCCSGPCNPFFFFFLTCFTSTHFSDFLTPAIRNLSVYNDWALLILHTTSSNSVFSCSPWIATRTYSAMVSFHFFIMKLETGVQHAARRANSDISIYLHLYFIYMTF